MPVGARSVELIGLADCRDSLVDADCVCDILLLQLLFVMIRWCYNRFACSWAAVSISGFVALGHLPLGIVG